MNKQCCPKCNSTCCIRNGLTRHGGQNHLCKNCGRQFVLDPQTYKISSEIKGLVNRLLLERLSLAGVCRATEISMTWLMHYISELYGNLSADLCLTIPTFIEGVFLTRVEADELWSFVGSKKSRQWVWLALDAVSRQVIACHIGGREKEDAEKLWEQIPKQYQLESDFYTDLLPAYNQAIPEDRLYQVKKKWQNKPGRKVELHLETTSEPSC